MRGCRWPRSQADALQPKPQGLPVNGRCDLEGDRSHRQKGSQQCSVVEVATTCGEHRYNDGSGPGAGSDRHGYVIAGLADAEIVAKVYVHEWRDIEHLL